MTNINKQTKKARPKFHKAYSTQFLKEIDALAEVGIRYHYVDTNEDGIRTYFFPKSPELYRTLLELHEKIRENCGKY